MDSSSSDLTARIRQLGLRAKVALSAHQLKQLVTYITILRRWNTTINLTSLDLTALPLPTLERLILEPLLSASLISAESGRWFDLGTGGGSPALPLKVVRPNLALTMVESRGRKVAFLREAARVMGVSPVDVVPLRIDELKHHVPAHDARLVTVRAVKLDANAARTIRYLLSASAEAALFGTDERVLLDAGFVRVRAAPPICILRPGVPRGTRAVDA